MDGNQIPAKTRNASIDLLKCIAMLLVIIYHSIFYSDNILTADSAFTYFRYFFRSIMSTCVTLFFFANGFLLLNKPFNLKKHIYKTLKLVFLAIIWAIITILILMPIRQEILSPSQFFEILIDWSQGWTNHLWFISTLVGLYIIFPLLKLAWDKDKRIFLFFATVCAVFTFGNKLLNNIVSLFSYYVLHSDSFTKVNFFNVFNFLYKIIASYSITYFCIGGYAFYYNDKILSVPAKKRNICAIVTMLICCTGLWLLGMFYTTSTNTFFDLVWDGYDSVFTLINTCCIYLLCLNFKKQSKLITTISNNTLGIYFVHIILIRFTRNYVLFIPGSHTQPFHILYSVIILFASLGIVLIMRKIPIINKLVKL